MTLKELERRIKKIQPVPMPMVILHYQNGREVAAYGYDALRMALEDNTIISASGGDIAGLINAIIHPLPNRRIEDYED